MTQHLLSAGLVFAGMLHNRARRAAVPSSIDDVSCFDSRRRRADSRPAEADLALLRRRRAELRLHEGRAEADRRARASWRRSEVFFRAHNLLTSGDGTPALKWGSTNAYREDAQGKPDLRLDDRRPDLRHLSRTRRAAVRRRSGSCRRRCPSSRSLTSTSGRRRRSTTRSITGWAYPPKDYEKWGELVYQWAKHCVEKYGREEVEQWYWEVWNEANIGYWRGTPEEFTKLHDYAIDGVRRALPTARVGGPDSAGRGGQFTRDFLEHACAARTYATGEIGTPLDFVAFHAKGGPTFVDGHVRHGDRQSARHDRRGFPRSSRRIPS